jgi:hypothetical protein
MALFAAIVAFLALAGAFASWIAGGWFYARTLRLLAAEPGHARLAAPARIAAVVAWPFALGRLKGVPTAHAAPVNKALVAFLACLMVAAAATSVATNLARVSR